MSQISPKQDFFFFFLNNLLIIKVNFIKHIQCVTCSWPKTTDANHLNAAAAGHKQSATFQNLKAFSHHEAITNNLKPKLKTKNKETNKNF